MSAPPTDPAPSASPRVVLWVALAALLLLLSSCAAYRVGQSSVDTGASPSPTGTPSPTATPTPTESTGGGDAVPAPTVVVTVTATPAATGGSAGGGSGSGDAQGPSSGSGSGTVTGGAGVPFTLTSAVPGGPLLLGQPRVLAVTVSNANARPLAVASITTTPGTPSAPGCQAAWLDVADFAATSGSSLVVPAGGTAVVDLALTLVNLAGVDQNACQGATFPIALHGTGSLT